MEGLKNEETKLNTATPTRPTSPSLPTLFASRAITSHGASTGSPHKGRREKGSRADHQKLRRKRRNGGCCKKDNILKMDGQIDGGVVDDDDGEEEVEKVGVERRIKALQKLVPGGEYLGPDKLFEETADYIVALQVQVQAMKMLASIFEGLEKEKTKVGA